jgi:hypothetical protein
VTDTDQDARVQETLEDTTLAFYRSLRAQPTRPAALPDGIGREQIEGWVGQPLTDDQFRRVLSDIRYEGISERIAELGRRAIRSDWQPGHHCAGCDYFGTTSRVIMSPSTRSAMGWKRLTSDEMTLAAIHNQALGYTA